MEIKANRKIMTTFGFLRGGDIFTPYPTGKLFVAVDTSRLARGEYANAISWVDGVPTRFANDEAVMVYLDPTMKL